MLVIKGCGGNSNTSQPGFTTRLPGGLVTWPLWKIGRNTATFRYNCKPWGEGCRVGPLQHRFNLEEARARQPRRKKNQTSSSHPSLRGKPRAIFKPIKEGSMVAFYSSIYRQAINFWHTMLTCASNFFASRVLSSLFEVNIEEISIQFLPFLLKFRKWRRIFIIKERSCRMCNFVVRLIQGKERKNLQVF